MRQSVRDAAKDRWPGILAAFGLTEKQLSGKHTACPVCGGRDRFRFDDKDGRGTFYCSHCGAGDGVALVMALRGIDFRTAAAEVEALAGVQPIRQGRPDIGDDDRLNRLRRVWSESKPLAAGDEAMRYLAGRGLDLSEPPDNLRLHSGLSYHDGDKVIGRFPCLVALVQAPDGSGVTLHRTYLQDGHKAPVESPRKLMSGKPITGAAIRLSRVVACLGIAEGLETALAGSQIAGMPVWSCVNAYGVETFEPPEGVTSVIVFADNDASFTGQKAAYATAHRLHRRGIHVEVRMPTAGDWLDTLNRGGDVQSL
jgi:putative DNA primase/helicase